MAQPNMESDQNTFIRANQNGAVCNNIKYKSKIVHIGNIKDLLTECEVCTGKYCLRFSYSAIKTEGNTFPYRPSKRG